MKKKILDLLTAQCKDMGLTTAYIGKLAERAANGLAEDATEDDIKKAVELYTEIAKDAQGEVTRKLQKSAEEKTAEEKAAAEKKAAEEAAAKKKADEEAAAKDEPEWAKKLSERLDALETAGETRKKEKEAATRQEAIDAKAKELGIPEMFMKRFSIADDEDYNEVLTSYKQQLIDNSLVSETETQGSSEKEIADFADEYLSQLDD